MVIATSSVFFFFSVVSSRLFCMVAKYYDSKCQHITLFSLSRWSRKKNVLRIYVHVMYMSCVDCCCIVRRRDKLERRVELLQHALSSEALSLFPDFQQRLGVLRRCGCMRDAFAPRLCVRYSFSSVKLWVAAAHPWYV